MKDELETISVDLKFIVKPIKDLPAAIKFRLKNLKDFYVIKGIIFSFIRIS